MQNNVPDGPGKTRAADGQTVSCLKCRHYYVTWDAGLPYGCRAHGFKSRLNPASVVFESSGLECQLFGFRRTPGRPAGDAE